jgi:hypothetical protein
MAEIARFLPVAALIDRLGREERLLKNLGAHEQAAGVRAAIVSALKLSDEDDPLGEFLRDIASPDHYGHEVPLEVRARASKMVRG